MAKAKLPPGPLKVFSANGTTAILDANGNEVVGWSGFDDSNRTKAEHELLARELVRRFNASGVGGTAKLPPMGSASQSACGCYSYESEGIKTEHWCEKHSPFGVGGLDAAAFFAASAKDAQALAAGVTVDRHQTFCTKTPIPSPMDSEREG